MYIKWVQWIRHQLLYNLFCLFLIPAVMSFTRLLYLLSADAHNLKTTMHCIVISPLLTP
ncbi:uncharacterized protein BDW43DRAFT_295476 [Aspergillus alliaceus]|uniref:uncharacterized protein n=1 Tax=Petromyces alliaceus TaxID=209559 RepID=UPI0012A4F429|nr:uncharacterized protein BDW43DRAFT_295476 [Aspergillus alliaceus]KAB8226880.1 hypothetical protein BDW43DRAFT_295476 [Aspergillus alliaceus]